jgi:hypothetical protein
LYDSSTLDPDLLYGHPQPIRSDEWKGWSTSAVLQAKTGFPQVNNNLGSGLDVAIHPDDATKNWLTFFRPQSWAYFFLPFENAFALRWWFGGALLMISAYFFVLKILKNKKLAIILSVGLTLSPFLIWWYQSALIIPLAYVFFILLLSMRIINQEKIPRIKQAWASNLMYLFVLSYLTTSFAFFLYAPFLIAFAIVACSFIVGYLLNKRLSARDITTLELFKKIGLLAMPLLITGLVGILFVSQHHELIDRLGNSEYPGHRVVESGELPYSPLYPLFGSYLMPLLQSDLRGQSYYTNQSEASNFILLLPFLIIPGLILQIYQYKKNKKVDYVFLSLQIISILLLIRIALPIGDGFFKFLLLNRVPNFRLIAGLGLAGFLQLIYFIKLITDVKLPKRFMRFIISFWTLAVFTILIIVGKVVMERYPIFLHEYYILILLAGFFTAIIFLLFATRVLLASILLLLFTVFSSFRIMPLYHGTSFFIESSIVKAMERVSKVDDNWIVLDERNFENLPRIAGRGQIGGSQIYPDFKLWQQLDPNNKYKYIYNREAHVLFLTNTLKDDSDAKYNLTGVNDTMELVKPNLFKVRFSCSKFIYDNVDFALDTHPINEGCLNLVEKVAYPKRTFYIYKVITPASEQHS